MLLYVDEAIWGAPSLFDELGTVRTFSGRSLRPSDLAEAEVLIVRSVTRVNEPLLNGSRVRFVATATSGADHVDTDYLAARGITFADAAGCNSRTVAEYVLAALLLLAERGGFDWAGKVLGIVGVGRIGSIVADWGRSLGMRVLLCDPPLQRAGNGGAYVSMAEVAAESDVISLHVPLVREGPDTTLGMIDGRWLSSVKKGATFINTSRGECVREDALLAAIEAGRLGPVVLDVWEGEPNVNHRLAHLAAIATPHIAGYSREARERAALMIRDRLADFLCVEISAADSLASSVDAGQSRLPMEISLDSQKRPRSAMASIVTQATAIADADRSLRDWIAVGGHAAGFDQLRAACAERREFPARPLIGQLLDDSLKGPLAGWGFSIS